jgi:DNA-binding transcriptional LysR family regulator
MEQELNAQLFERFGSRISLTTAGKVFAEYARQILDTKRQAFDAIRELDRVPRGEVTIAANEATCVNVLPQVFSSYKERFPEVQLQVIRSYGARTVEAVLENAVDFGITQLPVQERKLEIVQIHADEIRLLAPPAHPLAREEAVTAGQIARYNLLLPKSGRTRSRVNEYLEMVEDQLKISMELDSSEMIKQFIIAGLGVGFMAETNARAEIQRGALRAIPLAPLPMIRSVGLIYRKDKPLSRAALGFIEVVAEFARRHSSEPSAPKASRAS